MTYEYRHRVRYRECDPMGVVYHTHFLDHFEAARTEALREWGLAYRDLEAQGVILPVVDVHVRYHRPAHYDDLLVVTARFPEDVTTRVQVEYEVRREDEERVLVSGHVTLCFVDAERRRPINAPEQVTEIFQRRAA